MSAIKRAIKTVKVVVHKVTSANKRSSHWPYVRDKHLKQNPTCAACGVSTDLDVHHIKPFHLHPDLELDPDNLITLCMTNHCHIDIGHGDSFKAYNPMVKEDCEYCLAHKDDIVDIRPAMEDKAKKQRLFE